MARPKLQLAGHLNAAELKRRYRSCGNAKEARRWHVLWLMSQGYSVKDVAETVGLGVSWVRAVINRYNESGPDAIQDQHKINPGGKKPRLNAEQRAELVELLRKTPTGGGAWTGAKVAIWIQQKTGIETYPQLGWVYLRTFKSRAKSNKQHRGRTAGGKHV